MPNESVRNANFLFSLILFCEVTVEGVRIILERFKVVMAVAGQPSRC